MTKNINRAKAGPESPRASGRCPDKIHEPSDFCAEAGSGELAQDEGFDQGHGHDHEHNHDHDHAPRQNDRILVLRPHSGVSGDIMVTGLAQVAGLGQADLDGLLTDLGLGALIGKVFLGPRLLGGISGFGLKVELEPEPQHRTLNDIKNFLAKANLTEGARDLALSTFVILAQAEGRVHDLAPEQVRFHEVGAIDSLLDIGLAAAIFDRLKPDLFVCGPLPICDGTIECAHGLLPSPAPAVSILLEGVMVRGLNSHGETVTPTGLALLKSFGAKFGPWPLLTIERQALVFGTRVLPNVANGALFALGKRPA
ncbi:MAG: DUF111 family protein [Deltaproteobacteria bacterium]|nr:DUF111 family protein [Deltaproteobacteria bacterium]